MVKNINYMSLLALILLLLSACNKDITDFGYNGELSGTIKDASGNIVPGDITTANFIIRVKAEGDISTVDIRIKGDGKYANTKLYPAKSKIWITGPIVSQPATDTVVVDLTGGKKVVQDFVVKPVFSVAIPAVSGTPTSTSASFTYSITANSTLNPSKREIYCSTLPYPNTSTGSGPYYSTIKVAMTTNSGTVNVTGLTAGTKYYCRIGVQASSTQMNFSDQITFTTPK